MRTRFLYFIFLKLLIVSQFILILAKKHTASSKIYVFTDSIFKLSLALYILIFVWTSSYEGLQWEQKTIFSFSAALLIYDINYDAIVDELANIFPDNLLFAHLRRIEEIKADS
jgi:hypothetical protein